MVNLLVSLTTHAHSRCTPGRANLGGMSRPGLKGMCRTLRLIRRLTAGRATSRGRKPSKTRC